eukprot:gene19700-26392_t
MANATTGDENTIIGKDCAFNTNNIYRNLYIGNQTAFVASGNDNVAIGHAACLNSRALTRNVCLGPQIAQNRNGSLNVIVGTQSDFNGVQNIIVGNKNQALSDNCIVIGSGITATKPNSIIIGGKGVTDVRIGDSVQFGSSSTLIVKYGIDVQGPLPSFIRTPLFVNNTCVISDMLSVPKLVINDHWTVATSNNDLMFYSKNNAATYFNDTFEAGVLNFTGQHRCCMNSAKKFMIGMIVRSTGKYKNLDGLTKPTMNESILVVELSTGKNDASVFGVISGMKTDFKLGNLVFKPKVSKDKRVMVNSVGEGAMWVCDENGPLKNGDLITTSSIAGYGCRLLDDVVRNYTVAKITCDCDFSNGLHACLVGVVYKC